MPILYAAIAQKNDVFAEYPEREHPKLADVCAKIIATVPLNENCKKTFEESLYKFHYKSVGERVYICVSDKFQRGLLPRSIFNATKQYDFFAWFGTSFDQILGLVVT